MAVDTLEPLPRVKRRLQFGASQLAGRQFTLVQLRERLCAGLGSQSLNGATVAVCCLARGRLIDSASSELQLLVRGDTHEGVSPQVPCYGEVSGLAVGVGRGDVTAGHLIGRQDLGLARLGLGSPVSGVPGVVVDQFWIGARPPDPTRHPLSRPKGGPSEPRLHVWLNRRSECLSRGRKAALYQRVTCTQGYERRLPAEGATKLHADQCRVHADLRRWPAPLG